MIYAVISEFNPFHNGHRYLLSSLPKKDGDYTVCIMSGSFVQRGEPAAFDKWSRAAAAAENGADLVVELPLPFALSDGDRFAAKGVEMAASFGLPVTMAFGTECENLDGLSALAAIDEQALSAPLRAALEHGLSYGEARQRAYETLLPQESALLRSPNNLLALGYIRECLKRGIPYLGIRRTSPHDSAPQGSFASASYIRAHQEQMAQFCPISQGPALDSRAAEIGILSLLKAKDPALFAGYANISEGLENRIGAALTKATGLQNLYELIKTKRYSMAKLRRAVMACALELPRELPLQPPPYLHLLAIGPRGRALLREAKPLIPIAGSGKECEQIAPDFFQKERLATDLWNSWSKQPLPAGEEYRRGAARCFE
ncbi:MAG: nucleotidyltransferase family protein [Clostridia bacterium]|nr:nucleotidyltransferase family protein [Clostridia bacterium]